MANLGHNEVTTSRALNHLGVIYAGHFHAFRLRMASELIEPHAFLSTTPDTEGSLSKILQDVPDLEPRRRPTSLDRLALAKLVQSEAVDRCL